MKSLPLFIPSGARIVLVILVAIVLPSIMLSIFAVWAIGTERDQVQARIRADAQKLTEKVVEMTFSVLVSARTVVIPQAQELGTPEAGAELLDKLRSTRPYFTEVVIVTKEGRVIYPVMPSIKTMIDLGPAQAELRDVLEKAQNLEFVQKSLDEAAVTYKEIFENSSQERLKVSALLGLARVMAKQGKWAEALKSYSDILDKYGSQREENGLLVGPSVALRIAKISLEINKLDQSAETLVSVQNQLLKHRGELTQEEAVFFDAQLVSLCEKVIDKEISNPLQVRELRRIIKDVTRTRTHEAVTLEIARKISSKQSSDKDEIFGHEQENIQYVVMKVPVNIVGQKYIVCLLAPMQEVEQKLIFSEVKRLAMREEIGIVVMQDERGIVAGDAPAKHSYKLGESEFPAPFLNLRAEAYLKGYESLAALSDIRTNIYVWAVGLAISGIIAGAIVTYISVSRTMRAAELKSDFVSNVTHELKTPLTSIRMFAETLHEGRVQDEKDARECLETIVTESERLSRLIDKVLDFRAIEKGRRKFDFEVAELREVILETLETFKRQMRGYEATVYVNIPHDLPRLRIDKDAIGEVLLNLLTNAYKYSRPEDRRIWVTAQLNKDNVKVSIEDRGIGIPKRELKSIFEKFYRVDDRLIREVDGTGLGLTISKHVAMAHGGNIEVESREGRGSKFSLVLKL